MITGKVAVKRISRWDVLAVLLSVAYFVFLYNYANIHAPIRVPFSIDEKSVLVTADMFLRDGSLQWTSLLNEKYQVNFFRPRGVVEIGLNRYATSNSIGFALFLALSKSLQILQFVVPVLAVLGVLSAYLATSMAYDKKAGLIVGSTLGIIPTFVLYANTYMDIVPSISFYVMSLPAFLKYLKCGKTRYLVLCALFFSLSIFVRPYSAIFVIGYLAAIIGLPRSFRLKSLAIGAGSLCGFIIPLLVLNGHVYGDPLRVGYITPGDANPVLAQEIGGGVYLTAFINHIVLLFPVLFLVGCLGLVVGIKTLNTPIRKALLTNLCVTSMAAFFAFGFFTRTSSFFEVTPFASEARYLMPIYVCLVFGSYLFLKRISEIGMKRVSVFVFSILMISLLAGSMAANALPNLVQVERSYSTQLQLVDTYLPSNSVIFTRYYDKVFFPTRQIALVYTNSDLAVNPFLRYIVPVSDVQRDVVPAIRNLLHDGFHVFLAQDVQFLAPAIAEAGLVVSTAYPAALGFFEVSLGNSNARSTPQGTPSSCSLTISSLSSRFCPLQGSLTGR